MSWSLSIRTPLLIGFGTPRADCPFSVRTCAFIDVADTRSLMLPTSSHSQPPSARGSRCSPVVLSVDAQTGRECGHPQPARATIKWEAIP